MTLPIGSTITYGMASRYAAPSEAMASAPVRERTTGDAMNHPLPHLTPSKQRVWAAYTIAAASFDAADQWAERGKQTDVSRRANRAYITAACWIRRHELLPISFVMDHSDDENTVGNAIRAKTIDPLGLYERAYKRFAPTGASSSVGFVD